MEASELMNVPPIDDAVPQNDGIVSLLFSCTTIYVTTDAAPRKLERQEWRLHILQELVYQMETTMLGQETTIRFQRGHLMSLRHRFRSVCHHPHTQNIA